MATTLKDVAIATGLSVIAVSRILAGRNKENRPSMIRRAEEVRAVAARLGYRPHAGARAMRAGGTGAIALLATDSGYYLPLPLLAGIEAATAQAGRHLVYSTVADATLGDPAKAPLLLREHAADGLIITSTQTPDARALAQLQGAGIPSIWVNVDLPEDTVGPDDHQGGRLAAEALLVRGHRRLAYVEGTGTTHASGAERLTGVQAAVAGVGEVVARPADLAWLLAQPQAPTAVVAYADEDALAVLWACAQAGKVPGRDVALIALHHAPVLCGPWEVALAQVPWAEVGAQAVEESLARIARPGPRPRRRVPYTVLDPGTTLMPARA